METSLAVMAACVAIITLESIIALGVFVFVLYKVHQAALAVEILAFRTDKEVEMMGETLRSGWMQSLQGLLGLAANFWSYRRK